MISSFSVCDILRIHSTENRGANYIHVIPFIKIYKPVISRACPPNKVKTFCDTKRADLESLGSPWLVCSQTPQSDSNFELTLLVTTS